MHNRIDLDKLLELESKATPGKWDLNFYGGHLFLTYPMEGKFASSEDLELMVAMRNNICELCLELKTAREVVDIADRLAKYIEDEDDYRELRQAIKSHEKVTGTGGEK